MLWGVVFCLSDRQTLTKPRVGGKVGNRHSQSQTLLKRLQVGTFPGSSLAIPKSRDGKDPAIPLLRLNSSVIIGCKHECIMLKHIRNLASAVLHVIEQIGKDLNDHQIFNQT